jgi:hypothetical protein
MSAKIIKLEEASNALKLLLQDDHLCIDIARSHDSIVKVVEQYQRDMVTTENVETIGHQVLAIKQILDTLLLFATQGKEYAKTHTE